MTKDEYEDFVMRYKGCGACFPMYHTLSRFEKMWFSAIQKDVAKLEEENAELKADNDARKFAMAMSEKVEKQLREKNAELKKWQKDTIKARGNDYMAWSRQNDKLTKAKVALRNVIDYLGQFCTDYPDCVIEAEQFLNEVEK